MFRLSGFLRLPERFFKIIKISVIITLFVTIFLTFLRIKLWDYDFWYHISSGRYIISTVSLPDKDPFSYTSNLEENKNQFPEWENSVLKHYWLSQVIFYLIYDNAGANGIIILRSLLLALTIVIVFWRLQRWSVSFPVSFISVFSLYVLLLAATGERPVLFTFLFTALTFFILEDFKSKKDKRIFLLLPLMFLWSNLHAGFIVGVIIIAVFMLGEGIEMISGRVSYSRQQMSLFYTAVSIAIGISYINPTGWDAFSFALSPKYKPFFEGVSEYHSPFFLYKNKIVRFWDDLSFIVLAVAFPVIVALRNKRICLTHIILLSGMLIMSLSAIRFKIFYGITASMVLGRELDILINDLLRKRFLERVRLGILNGLTMAVLPSTVLFAFKYLNLEGLDLDIARRLSVPRGAVDFIEKNRLPGNMFNSDKYGGYITWRLYPWKKNFYDTRTLNLAVKLEYLWIIDAAGPVPAGATEASSSDTPLWERLLGHYKINFVFLSLLNSIGQMPQLIFKFLESDKWVPVYSDSISIIFMRNADQNSDIIRRFRVSKDDIYNTIIYVNAQYALHNKVNPAYLLSLGEVFYRAGRLKDTLRAYEYALKRMPEDHRIKERINKIKSEINKRE